MQDSYPTQVYHLGDFPEIIKGVATAKSSRSQNTFLHDAESMGSEGADKFHEKWVVGYGHESVADMSIGSACFEDVPIVIAEKLFDVQTGKFQAKSSRYVPYSRERVSNPWAGEGGLEEIYLDAIDTLYDAYEGLHGAVEAYVRQEWPDEKAHVVRGRVFDALRYLLPLGALTNVGTRLSGRDTSALVRELLSSPLEEERSVGEKLKAAGMAELSPSMIRHAEASVLFNAQREMLRQIAQQVRNPDDSFYQDETLVRLVDFDEHGDLQVAEALVFEATGVYPYMLYESDKRNAIDTLNRYLSLRKIRQDLLPHALRFTRYRFAIAADFGVWKDLRRHRRNELDRTTFGARFGYTVPDDIKAIGGEVLATFTRAMDLATAAWQLLAQQDPYRAQYVVTHGHIQHFVMDMDAQQLFYIGELRTGEGGHISYRRVAAEMVRQASSVHPELYRHILVKPVDGIAPHRG